MITVAVETLGCKVNQAESEKMSRQLAAAGYKIVPVGSPADIYILNSCTVTRAADSKSRHWLRTTHRANPDAALVVTGCYAERAAADLAKLEGVKLVIGNAGKPQLVELLRALAILPVGTICPIVPIPYRTRAFIKVQDGCSNFCAYCIVPFVRNNETSMPPEQIVSEIKQRQAEGYKEVVITGVEVGSYNSYFLSAGAGLKPARPCDLSSLLSFILTETSLPRLRLSSLQPPEVTPEPIGLWQNPRLCRHFHLSLQSGSDTVLKRMNHRYTKADYAAAVDLIRSVVPDAAVTTDIITAFPEETDAEFNESFEFCKNMDFARIHVFPYSPRKGTRAAGFAGQVDEKVKKIRTDIMLKLGEECIDNFSRKFLGKTMPVLFEQKEKSGLWSGLTDNYIRVYTESNEDLANKIVDAQLNETHKDGILGKKI